MALEDIRESIPTEIASLVLEDEKIYFYGTGAGCLGGRKTYILVTESRVLGSAIQAEGCLGMSKSATVDIPLEHISSTRTGTTGGCLGFFGEQTVMVSSGTATSAFITTNAQQAANIIQQALREAKRN